MATNLKVMFADLDPQEREEHLRANCDRPISGYNYTRQLTEKEIAQQEKHLSTLSIELDRLDRALKDIKADYKHEMDPIKKEIKEIINTLRTGFIEETGTVYSFLSSDGYKELYNEQGILVSRTRALGAERQMSVGSHLRDEVEQDDF